MSDPAKFKTTTLDRVLMSVAPKYALSRMQARAAAATFVRHFEAASVGRRTQNWQRRTSDANSSAGGNALSNLRAISRDLVRNNGWARNALRVIPRNVVGWGITPKVPKALAATWKTWAGTTQCDAAGRLTFAGLEKLVIRGVVESGEMLVRRRWRRAGDGLAIPMQLQVLEPDFIDTSKNGIPGELPGSRIVQGIEFDRIGRRVAYWLFEEHPGSILAVNPVSRRIPASEIIHVYDMERAGQDRGYAWLCAAIVKLKDFDEFEDAQLMRQKIAACFAAFVTDYDGETGSLVGQPSTDDPLVESIEPGMVQRLPPGKQITTANPPLTTDDGFSTRTLRGIAAAIGVTYEDLTGDYSQVNFSSARMSRLAHWGNVYDWQFNMAIPQLCDPAWAWAMEAAALAGLASDVPPAEWTPTPMPMIEPDREARANILRVRGLQATPSQVIREQGGDPAAFLAEYAADLKRIDALGIWTDADVRRVSQAGLTQARPGGTGFNDDAKDAEEMAAKAEPPSGDGAAPDEHMGEDEMPDEMNDAGE